MLNMAVETGIAPQLGAMERQRWTGQSRQGEWVPGRGDTRVGWFQRQLAWRGGNPAAHGEDTGTPRAGCMEKRKPPSGPIC